MHLIQRACLVIYPQPFPPPPNRGAQWFVLADLIPRGLPLTVFMMLMHRQREVRKRSVRSASFSNSHPFFPICHTPVLPIHHRDIFLEIFFFVFLDRTHYAFIHFSRSKDQQCLEVRRGKALVHSEPDAQQRVPVHGSLSPSAIAGVRAAIVPNK